jgi:HEAT repeat protein
MAKTSPGCVIRRYHTHARVRACPFLLGSRCKLTTSLSNALGASRFFCTQRRIAFNSMLVDTLLSFVDDPEHRVSSAALSSLVDVAERGSAKVVCAILQYLSNPYRVDAVSIKLLGKTAPVGHAQALELLVRCLGAPGSAGDAALEVLGNIAVRGDVATLDGVLLQLEVGDLRTKARAIAAMPLVNHYGDQNALGKLRNLVSHRSWHVRVAAVKSLRSISQPDMGEEQAIPALLMCLQGDSEEVVRICALDALSVCAQQFDLPTLKLLVNCVTDSNLLVRRRAAILLARWSLAPTHTDDSAAISKASEAAAAEVTKAGSKDGVLLPGTKSKAQKAAAEAGATAAADAQRERKEHRQNLLSIVTQMLMHHVRCSDSRTRAAAAWSLGMLSCCGSCADAGSVSSNLMQALQGATAISKPFDDMRIHSGDLAQSGVHMELAVTFESIFLLCDADDVEQLLCMVSLPKMIKHCVEALAELSRDLLENATHNARPSEPHKCLGGQNPTNAPMHLFGNTSAEHLREIILSRLIVLLEPSTIVDEAKASKSSKSSKSSKLSAADMAEKKGALQKAAARRWMAVLAMRRCALEALARHVHAVGATEANESEKLGAGAGASRGSGGGGANVRAHSCLFGNEHPLFEGLGAGGKRLKSTILPVLVSLIQVEQDPLVRRATTSLLLELFPAGARGDSINDANERRQQVTGTVLDSIVARIQDMMQEDIQDQQLRATAAKEEKKEEQEKQNAVAWGSKKWGAEGLQKESGKGKAKVKSEKQIARDRLSMQAYVRLLGDFGALTEYDLFESALDKTMTGKQSLLLQALTASHPNFKVGTADNEEGTADNEHVLMRLLDPVPIANSCYNFPPIRNLAVRALGIAMRGQPTAKSAESVLRVLTEGIDADSLVVVLAALLRMERLHEFSDVIDWPRHLRRIAQFLGHKDMAVQAMAQQVLHNQMHLRDSFIACTAEQVLHNQMHLRHSHQPAIQDALVTQLGCSSSLTRSRALGLLTSGHQAKSINTSAVLTEAVTSCLYDHDTIVRSQAHDLLKLLTTATLANSRHRDSHFVDVGPPVAGGGLEGEGEGEVKADVEAIQAALAASKELGDDGRSSAAAAKLTATVDPLHPQQQQWDPMCVMIEGKPTRWSELMKEPPGERATVAAKKHWIGSLLTMKIFDQTSVAAVTEKLGASEHWSVRRSAVEYLLCALKAPPPPGAETSSAQSLQPALAAVDNEEAERSNPVGWENEAETARTALAYLQSEDAGVRNSAAAMLATLLPSGKGAREAILEQDSLEILLSDTRARHLCFKVFSSDGSMREKCQQALKDHSISVRRSATGSMWALHANDPPSKALDMLLVCSRDPDLSVGASAMDLWQKQDMTACDPVWRAAAVEKLSKHARHQREMGASRAIAVRGLLALVHKGDVKVAALMLVLLEDASVQVREAAADVLVEVADPTSDIVGHLIDVVERHVSDWNPPRRDGAEREIQAAAFWVLSRLQPQFSQIPDHVRSCGNRRIIQFLWGNADNERELIRQEDLKVWVRETLAAGDSLIVKVRRAIAEGRWEDARNDANAAMAEYLLAKSKGSHPAIFERILMVDGIFSDIANFRGRTFERAIDTKIQAVDQSWVTPSDAIDNEGWTRLHYFSRWNMPV